MVCWTLRQRVNVRLADAMMWVIRRLSPHVHNRWVDTSWGWWETGAGPAMSGFLCRMLGHAWQPTNVWKPRGFGNPIVTLMCVQCLACWTSDDPDAWYPESRNHRDVWAAVGDALMGDA